MSYNRIPELVENLQALNNHHLEIGILSGQAESEIVMIAAVHEFGVQISVTPKMRAYLHHIGIHLKAETDTINIPERSFIRDGWDAKNDDVLKKIEHLLGMVLDGKLDAMTFYEAIGGQVVSYLQEYLVALSTPPLAQSTIDRKGSSNPLVDTGRLGDSITWKVV